MGLIAGEPPQRKGLEVNVFLNRESPVPLHDQLCAQVGQLVASGSLAPGQRLPSIRGLAGRLGVHHNTVLAAYRTLAARGVLEIREGSGVRVADLAPAAESEGGWREGLALRAMAAHFVAMARARGSGEEEILAACREALAPRPLRRLVVVNPHPDLQTLYLHELARDLDFPMAGMDLEGVEAAGGAGLADACLLTSTNHVASVRRLLGEDAEVVIFRLASAEPLLARAREIPQDEPVAVISASPRYLFLIAELLAGVRGEGAIMSAALEDPEAVGGALRLASLVVTDSWSRERLPPAALRAPVVTFRLLADDVLADLAGRLPPEVFRPEVSHSS